MRLYLRVHVVKRIVWIKQKVFVQSNCHAETHQNLSRSYKTRKPWLAGSQFKQQSRFFLLSPHINCAIISQWPDSPDPSLLFRTAVAALEIQSIVINANFSAWQFANSSSMGNFPLICKISQDSSLLPIFIMEAFCCMEM